MPPLNRVRIDSAVNTVFATINEGRDYRSPKGFNLSAGERRAIQKSMDDLFEVAKKEAALAGKTLADVRRDVAGFNEAELRTKLAVSENGSTWKVKKPSSWRDLDGIIGAAGSSPVAPIWYDIPNF